MKVIVIAGRAAAAGASDVRVHGPPSSKRLRVCRQCSSSVNGIVLSMRYLREASVAVRRHPLCVIIDSVRAVREELAAAMAHPVAVEFRDRFLGSHGAVWNGSGGGGAGVVEDLDRVAAVLRKCLFVIGSKVVDEYVWLRARCCCS